MRQARHGQARRGKSGNGSARQATHRKARRNMKKRSRRTEPYTSQSVCDRLANCSSYGETIEVVERALYEQRLALLEQLALAFERGPPLLTRSKAIDLVRGFK